MENTEKVRENKLRLMADRRGLRLWKSRTRDTGAVEYGKYHITESNFVIMGMYNHQFEANLDEVEDFLNEYQVSGT